VRPASPAPTTMTFIRQRSLPQEAEPTTKRITPL
jgi:hypothetical protein